jgi:hypothetical protein
MIGLLSGTYVPLVDRLSDASKPAHALSHRVVRAASGRVLGNRIGSGLNLPFYSQDITQVLGLAPSSKLSEMAREARSA